MNVLDGGYQSSVKKTKCFLVWALTAHEILEGSHLWPPCFVAGYHSSTVHQTRYHTYGSMVELKKKKVSLPLWRGLARAIRALRRCCNLQVFTLISVIVRSLSYLSLSLQREEQPSEVTADLQILDRPHKSCLSVDLKRNQRPILHYSLLNFRMVYLTWLEWSLGLLTDGLSLLSPLLTEVWRFELY